MDLFAGILVVAMILGVIYIAVGVAIIVKWAIDYFRDEW